MHLFNNWFLSAHSVPDQAQGTQHERDKEQNMSVWTILALSKALRLFYGLSASHTHPLLSPQKWLDSFSTHYVSDTAQSHCTLLPPRAVEGRGTEWTGSSPEKYALVWHACAWNPYSLKGRGPYTPWSPFVDNISPLWSICFISNIQNFIPTHFNSHIPMK